jgi:hypothetical protein
VANVLDRLAATPHEVTDFIALGSFPVFNAADVSITAGFHGSHRGGATRRAVDSSMSDENDSDAFDGEVLDLIVPSTLHDIRIDRVLSMLTGLSRSETSAMLANGAVTLDDKVVVKASFNVEGGQHLVALVPTPHSGIVDADADVLVAVVLDDDDFCRREQGTWSGGPSRGRAAHRHLGGGVARAVSPDARLECRGSL